MLDLQPRLNVINILTENISRETGYITSLDTDAMWAALNVSWQTRASLQSIMLRIRSTNDGALILVNGEYIKHEPLKVSIAHGVAHWIMHQDNMDDPMPWTIGLDNRLRTWNWEAETFALALLMPKSVFIDVAEHHQERRGYLTKPIAEHFQVPERQVLQRGKMLGIFQRFS